MEHLTIHAVLTYLCLEYLLQRIYLGNVPVVIDIIPVQWDEGHQHIGDEALALILFLDLEQSSGWREREKGGQY
jgi:hypothetical protein